MFSTVWTAISNNSSSQSGESLLSPRPKSSAARTETEICQFILLAVVVRGVHAVRLVFSRVKSRHWLTGVFYSPTLFLIFWYQQIFLLGLLNHHFWFVFVILKSSSPKHHWCSIILLRILLGLFSSLSNRHSFREFNYLLHSLRIDTKNLNRHLKSILSKWSNPTKWFYQWLCFVLSLVRSFPQLLAFVILNCSLFFYFFFFARARVHSLITCERITSSDKVRTHIFHSRQ